VSHVLCKHLLLQNLLHHSNLTSCSLYTHSVLEIMCVRCHHKPQDMTTPPQCKRLCHKYHTHCCKTAAVRRLWTAGSLRNTARSTLQCVIEIKVPEPVQHA
jgi:hypothetical protein